MSNTLTKLRLTLAAIATSSIAVALIEAAPRIGRS